MTEQALQTQMLRLLKKRGVVAIKTLATNRNGTADILGVLPGGRFLALEVKAPGKLKTVTVLQKKYLADVRKAGGVGVLVDNLKVLDDILDSLIIL